MFTNVKGMAEIICSGEGHEEGVALITQIGQETTHGFTMSNSRPKLGGKNESERAGT
jgi:hypothetical protein